MYLIAERLKPGQPRSGKDDTGFKIIVYDIPKYSEAVDAAKRLSTNTYATYEVYLMKAEVKVDVMVSPKIDPEIQTTRVS